MYYDGSGEDSSAHTNVVSTSESFTSPFSLQIPPQVAAKIASEKFKLILEPIPGDSGEQNLQFEYKAIPVGMRDWSPIQDSSTIQEVSICETQNPGTLWVCDDNDDSGGEGVTQMEIQNIQLLVRSQLLKVVGLVPLIQVRR